jgi:drug/metabolite transporter (DMT)-like permease
MRFADTPVPVHLALLAVQILFGLWPVAGVAVMGHLTPAALIGLRTLLAVPILLALFRPARPALREWPGLAVLGMLGVSANQLLYAEGLKRCGPVHAAVLTLLIPPLTLLMARLAGREQPTARRMMGVAVAMIGALVLVRPERAGGATDDTVLLGDLLIVANTVSYAAYLVFARRTAQRLGSQAMVTWVFVAGALLALPVTGPALATLDPSTVPLWGWGSLAFIVLGATVGTYGLNAYALARAESSLVAVYIYLQPLVSTAAAALFLDAHVEGRALVAGAVIAVGVYLSAGLSIPSIRRR